MIAMCLSLNIDMSTLTSSEENERDHYYQQIIHDKFSNHYKGVTRKIENAENSLKAPFIVKNIDMLNQSRTKCLVSGSQFKLDDMNWTDKDRFVASDVEECFLTSKNGKTCVSVNSKQFIVLQIKV